MYLSAFVSLTLSEVGEVRGILSATTVNSLVNSWAMTGTDSDFAAAWNHQEAHKDHLYDYNFEVDKSVHGMTSQDEAIGKQSNATCGGRTVRDCKCMKAFVHSPRLWRSSGDVS